MTEAMKSAGRFQDLLQVDGGGPYLYSRIFNDDGRRARSNSKKKFKLLKHIEPVLTPMLHEGERVFFLTKGVTSLSFLEWWFFGWVLYVMNFRAIVLTSERILFLQINSRNKPRELRSQVSWAAITRIASDFWGGTKVEFRNGRRLKMSGVPRADRKWLKTVMNDVLGKFESRSRMLEFEHLCPHCFEPMTMGPIRCPHCDGALKSAGKAALLSLLYPGAGDLYLGHKVFAFLELLGVTIFWFALIGLAVAPTVPIFQVLIAADEAVRYFHSNAVFSILDEGNLFTDDRIVSYVLNADSMEYFATSIAEVADLHMFPADQPGGNCTIYVVPERPQPFLMIVPPSQEGGQEFMEALLDHWRAVRTARNYGVWFDGGMGNHPDSAVIVFGVALPDSLELAERWWLNRWLGQEGVAWNFNERTSFMYGGRPLDQISIQGPDGALSYYLFGVAPPRTSR